METETETVIIKGKADKFRASYLGGFKISNILLPTFGINRANNYRGERHMSCSQYFRLSLMDMGS